MSQNWIGDKGRTCRELSVLQAVPPRRRQPSWPQAHFRPLWLLYYANWRTTDQWLGITKSGHKRTSMAVGATSALPAITDITRTSAHVRKVPLCDVVLLTPVVRSVARHRQENVFMSVVECFVTVCGVG